MNTCAKLLAITLMSGAMASSATGQGFFLTADAGALLYSNTESLAFFGDEFNNPGAINIGGGFNFNRNFGVEVGHTIVGDAENTFSSFEKLKSSVNHVAFVGTLPVGNHSGFFAKIGWARTSIDYRNNGTGFAYESASGSSTNLMLGFGWEYNFNRYWGLHVQYRDFGKTQVGPIVDSSGAITALGGDIGMSLFSVGGVYNF